VGENRFDQFGGEGTGLRGPGDDTAATPFVLGPVGRRLMRRIGGCRMRLAQPDMRCDPFARWKISIVVGVARISTGWRASWYGTL
jgi:hypothetical protein